MKTLFVFPLITALLCLVSVADAGTYTVSNCTVYIPDGWKTLAKSDFAITLEGLDSATCKFSMTEDPKYSSDSVDKPEFQHEFADELRAENFHVLDTQVVALGDKKALVIYGHSLNPAHPGSIVVECILDGDKSYLLKARSPAGDPRTLAPYKNFLASPVFK